jgi:YVTN family beta-propeller protein
MKTGTISNLRPLLRAFSQRRKSNLFRNLFALFAIPAGAGMFLGVSQARAQNAYIANFFDNTVSVIDTATNTMTGSPISVGHRPFGVAVSPDGSKVYVTNEDDYTVSVIDTVTNLVIATISVGRDPIGVAVTPDGRTAYVTNFLDSTVSVIDTATNTVIGSPISEGIGINPSGVAVSPDGSKVYVTNQDTSGSVSVIETAANFVTAIIPVGSQPSGVAVSPDGSKVYVANSSSGTVSVIETETYTVIKTIPVGNSPEGVAVTPDGSTVYVTNGSGNTGGNSVSVIDTTTNAVIGLPIAVGINPSGVAVSPDGSKVYVANFTSNTASVIDTATNMVTATIPGFSGAQAFGIFILPRFAGSPGQTECYGKSLRVLVKKYGTLDHAAKALGYPRVKDLKNAIESFCGQ